ncbi:MAG: oxygen-independent coproporphyrinogen III oxidase-like protein [gamma proteobacterium symbiont of Phacoides pectinatus]
MFDSPVPLSLYIHIPWCLRKCPYCDFNSHRTQGCPDAHGYVRALLADLDLELPLTGGRRVETLFIGGGTPSLFPPEAILTLLLGVRRRVELAADAEVTMEANPGALEAGRFTAYREAGVNRLSLGIQSFDDEALKALGRVHDAAQARRAIGEAAAAGFDTLNLDLMFGLPGQDAGAAQRDLEQALAFAPDHISYYQLTVEPNTAYHRAPPALPPEDTLARMQEEGEERLEGAGYRQYEVSAYARPGRRCRHNLNYWRFGDYIGIGAGAHGKLTDAPSQAVWRRWRLRHPGAYLDAAGGEAVLGGRQRLERDDLVAEFMLNALRLNEGFDLALFEAHTGLSRAVLAPRLAREEARGLLRLEGTQVRPTRQGRRFLNDLVSAFL